ncbi:hypothetical protein [Arthrobacter sp. MMS24-S77]
MWANTIEGKPALGEDDAPYIAMTLGAGSIGKLGKLGKVAKGARGAESAIAGRNLGRQLASEQQMGEAGTALAGAGSSGKLRVADRLAIEYGGTAADWAKMGSSSYKGTDGFRMETHWYENVLTGERFEFKTEMMWLP